MSLQARQLAMAGFDCWLPDLFGTGDSEGEVRSATWQIWLQDLEDIFDVALKEAEAVQSYVVGVRLGCPLVQDYLDNTTRIISGVALWQPVLKGRSIVSQLVRMRLVQERRGSNNSISVKDIEAEMDRIGYLESGGYRFNLDLLNSIGAIDMSRKRWNAQTVHIFELHTGDKSSISPVTENALLSWRRSGSTVNHIPLAGAPFYGTAEIVENYDLLAATKMCLAYSADAS